MNTLQYKYYEKGVIYSGDHYKRTKLTPSEAKSIMNKYNALYLRNIYDFDTDEETNYYHVIQDKFYDIDELPSKSTRKNLRKSLNTYRYEIVSKNEILKYGYKIFCEAAIRFNIKPSRTSQEFVDYINEIYNQGGDFWIGYDIASGEPAMWESILKFDDNVVMDIERLSYKFTKGNPTYGLNYKITEYYIKEKGYKYIDAGAISITQHSNVQDFLINKLQFRRAFCRSELYFKPWINFLLALGKPIFPLMKYFPNSYVKHFCQMITIYRHN